MKVLLLSAYGAASHRYWTQGLTTYFSRWEWTCLELPGRFFNWRIRGNPLTWSFRERERLSERYDLVVATSMVDLATLRGLVPSLATTPTLLYCHENQFCYPRTAHHHASVDSQMVTLYAALAADRVLFNSAFNQRTFLDGVGALLGRLPDAVPEGVVDCLVAKARVVPVPLAEEPLAAASRSKPLTLAWNHRWEHDKGPERLLAALECLAARGVDFRLHLLGERFRRCPPALESIRERFADRLLSWGYRESRREYLRCLAQSHVVLSTSLHEFQGLAVLEAVRAGCLPLVPDRLSYPELFDRRFRYPSWEDAPELEADKLAERLQVCAQQVAQQALPAPPDVSHLLWSRLGPAYQRQMEEVAFRGGVGAG